MKDDQSGVFRALADPTRRQILQDLREGDLLETYETRHVERELS